MKITVKTTQTTTIVGSLSEADLATFIRERLKLPESAQVAVHNIDTDEELAFRVTLSEDVGPSAEALPVPVREEHRCSVPGCQFPSLAGGLCPSHLSEGHRRRHNTLPSR